MRAYCNATIVVATHDDHQKVDPSVYGQGVDVVVVPDDFVFERLGAAPAEGEEDDRQLARPVLDLAEVKQQLRRAVDEAAETERLKYITAGAGQAMTYQRKVEEARRHQTAVAAEEEIDPANYPLLAASIGIDGPDLAAVAAVVLTMDAAWAQIGAAIEATRLAAKQAIEDAEGEPAARASAAAEWPQPEIHEG